MACSNIVFTVSVCQQAEVAYPYKAIGQYMKKEPSDELICLERHGLLTVAVGIIPPPEKDFAILDIEDAVIADGDPVGISAEILENTFGTAKGRFAIDDPLLFIELFPEGIEGA
jgi:hypothetical protein